MMMMMMKFVVVSLLLCVCQTEVGARERLTTMDGHQVEEEGNGWYSSITITTDEPCSNFTTCDQCTNQTYCGWCAGTRLCLNGTKGSGSSEDGTCGVEQGWHTHSAQCRECAQHKSCGQCVSAYPTSHDGAANSSFCGWCDDPSLDAAAPRCLEGTVNGSFAHLPNHNGSCSAHSWGYTKSFCGDDDSSSHKRKMAIVVGLSVAGGIFVLAVASTIVFVLVRRSRKLDGYTTINEGDQQT